MKIYKTKWKTYSTPYLNFIPNDTYLQISFIIWNYHFWVIINKTNDLAN